MVGLSVDDISNGVNKKDIDNGKWRMPTQAEHETLVVSDPPLNKYKDYNGMKLDITVNEETLSLFYPLVGQIWGYDAPDGLNTKGYYWSADTNGENSAKVLEFPGDGTFRTHYMGPTSGFPIRCVPRKPTTTS